MYKLPTRFLYHGVLPCKQILAEITHYIRSLLTYTDNENDLSSTEFDVRILQVRIKPLLPGLRVSSHVVAIVRVVRGILLLWLTILLGISTMLSTISLLVHALLHICIHLVATVHGMVISHHLLRRENVKI